MRSTVLVFATLLLACASEVPTDPCDPATGGSASETGGAGGTPDLAGGQGQGGEPQLTECTPGKVCRDAHHACDAEEVCNDEGECPRDAPAPYASEPLTDCGLYLCDGHRFDCPEECFVDEDCATGSTCLDGQCAE